MVLIFAIPAALTYTYGKMARDTRQGWALFAAMALLFLAGVALAYQAEAGRNPALAGPGARPTPGTWRARKSASASPTAPCSPP